MGCGQPLDTYLRGDGVLDTAQLLNGAVEVILVADHDAHNYLQGGLNAK